MTKRLWLPAALPLTLFFASDVRALCTGTSLTVEVGVWISTSTSTTSAPGRAQLLQNGQPCSDLQVTAKIKIVQDGNTEYVGSDSRLGEVIYTLQAPAYIGSCYTSSIEGSGGLNSEFQPFTASGSSGPACWQGPPPDPCPTCPLDPDTCPECPPSPIVLDIGNDGYRLTSPADGVAFDLRNEGMKRTVAWTEGRAENAFLAMDRDGNGTIDNGSELFGNFTPLRSGTTAPNGFVALAELDDNGDHRIDAADAVWNSLLLWIDRDHDGLSTKNEIEPIGHTPVLSLSVDYQSIGRRDRWGNEFRYMSEFACSGRARDHHRRYFDVFLQTE